MNGSGTASASVPGATQGAGEARPSILFLARSLNVGGAERQLAELAIGLHARGWEVLVAIFYPGGPFETALREAGVRVVCLEKRGRWDVFTFLWRLARLLRQRRPHIAHGYLDTPNILLSMLRLFSPGTRVVWGVRASNMNSQHYDILFDVERYVGVMFSRCADLIICNAHAGRTYHAELGYPAERMIVIPNGIDLSRFRPDAPARAALRAEWGVGPDEKLIGLIGRLDPMKDPETFLRAAAALAAHKDLRFVVVGDGPARYRDDLGALARTLGLAGRLAWYPARPDVWRVYNALDVLVSSSSEGEGFSNTIAEAMATGRACVVTDVGDSAVLVGDLGWVCRPRDSTGIAAGISSALAALPVDGSRIRDHIATNYGIEALLCRSLAHLGRLVAPESPGLHVPRKLEH